MKGIGYYLATAITALLFIRGTESAAHLFRVGRSIRVCTPRDVARIGHFMCKRSVLPAGEQQDGGTTIRQDERSLEHREKSKDSNTFSSAESIERDAFWEESPDDAFHDNIYPFLELKGVTYYDGQTDGFYFDGSGQEANHFDGSDQIEGSYSDSSDQIGGSGHTESSYFDGNGHTEGTYSDGNGQIDGSYSDGSGQIDGSYSDGSGQIDGSYSDGSGHPEGSYFDGSGHTEGSYSDISGQIDGSYFDGSGHTDGSGQIDSSYFDGSGHIYDFLVARKLQKRSNNRPRKFETIADIRKYCCHDDCPIELFLCI
ncbi:uncharacterized protein LOC135202436 [Macrobrachium nipponense]|uniref:uncharacterized protein LOC135202436 n=1 Tax=Macrobrachium nipponense TaxID=159736 RepID=UPI0030C7D99B